MNKTDLDRPRLVAPPGSCDCHMHVFDPHYPLRGGADIPADSGLDDYLAVRQVLGLERVVFVQPNGYAFDNRALLDALRRVGSSARGVAVVKPEVDEAELQRLTDLGVRGVRFHLLPGGSLGWDDLEGVAAKIRPFGWHVQVQLDGWQLGQHAERLRALPVDCVIDHVGKFLGSGPPEPDARAFKALLGLLDGGRCWVKLSAPYESSHSGPSDYDDVGRLARTLAGLFPERCVWASNWPHLGRDPAPPNAAMLDLLLAWADDEATRRRILVDNPARLYGLEPQPAPGDGAPVTAEEPK